MNYLDALCRATVDLNDGDADAAAQAALQLAIGAWRQLAGVDRAWDVFGLELLDVADRLYPYPDVAVNAEPPESDDPQLRAAVVDLVGALAQRCDRVAADETLPLTERLRHSAAGEQLRHAQTALA